MTTNKQHHIKCRKCKTEFHEQEFVLNNPVNLWSCSVCECEDYDYVEEGK